MREGCQPPGALARPRRPGAMRVYRLAEPFSLAFSPAHPAIPSRAQRDLEDGPATVARPADGRAAVGLGNLPDESQPQTDAAVLGLAVAAER